MSKDLNTLIQETLILEADTQIHDDHGPGQLEGWDSLGHVQIVSALEAAYGISIGMDEVLSLESVRDIKSLLKGKGVERF